MRLKGLRRSSNIEDRRRSGGGKAAIGGIGGLGLLVVLAVGYFTGIDVTPILNEVAGQPQQSAPRELSAEEERAATFSSQVLATTEEVWTGIFEEQVGRAYTPPVMVLFSGQTASPCGGASRSTARAMRRPISIPNSLRPCRASLARGGILRRPM